MLQMRVPAPVATWLKIAGTLSQLQKEQAMNNKPEPVLPLFDQPQARKTDPKTSHSAARRVKANSVRHRILNAMEASPYTESATWQIAQRMGVSRDSVSPHMRPLKVMGYVMEMGEIENPATGNKCFSWMLTQKYQESGLSRGHTPSVANNSCPMCGKTL